MSKFKYWLWDRLFLPYRVQQIDGLAAMLAPQKGCLFISIPTFIAKDLEKNERVWLDRRGNLRRKHEKA